MPKWTREKLEERIADLRKRLSAGENISDIAKAWSTSKQNVSQFRKRYIPGEKSGNITSTMSTKSTKLVSQDISFNKEGDDAFIIEAYKLIIARDNIIEELEKQIRGLKLKACYSQINKIGLDQAKEFLQGNIKQIT